jgi:DNA-binding XRE family transcriptional regulator
MRLSKYIRKMGVTAFAKKVGCTPQAAHHWQENKRSPRPEWARKIVANTELSLEDIYGKAA